MRYNMNIWPFVISKDKLRHKRFGLGSKTPFLFFYPNEDGIKTEHWNVALSLATNWRSAR